MYPVPDIASLPGFTDRLEREQGHSARGCQRVNSTRIGLPYEEHFQDCTQRGLGCLPCSIHTPVSTTRSRWREPGHLVQLAPPDQKPELLATAGQSVVELGHQQTASRGEMNRRSVGALAARNRSTHDEAATGQAPPRPQPAGAKHSGRPTHHPCR